MSFYSIKDTPYNSDLTQKKNTHKNVDAITKYTTTYHPHTILYIFSKMLLARLIQRESWWRVISIIFIFILIHFAAKVLFYSLLNKYKIKCIFEHLLVPFFFFFLHSFIYDVWLSRSTILL